jgi:uncharacterized protein DUF3995
MAMVLLVGMAVAAVFAALAGLHLYWAAGGGWGSSVAVPEVAAQPAFRPGPLACIGVALLLASAAALVVATAGHRPIVTGWLPPLGTAVVALVMLLRAIGDFRLVGFCKKVRGTRFAQLDSALFSPLCLALALGCLVVVLAR